MSQSVSLEKNHAAFSAMNEPVVKSGTGLKAFFIVACTVAAVATVVMGAVTVGFVGFTVAAACTGFGLPVVLWGVAGSVFAAMSTVSCIGVIGYSISGLTI